MEFVQFTPSTRLYTAKAEHSTRTYGLWIIERSETEVRFMIFTDRDYRQYRVDVDKVMSYNYNIERFRFKMNPRTTLVAYADRVVR